MKKSILIMTPLPVEYHAVSRHLSERKSLVHDGAAYEIGKFQTKHENFDIIIAEPGMRNTSMAISTERAIQHFQPQFAILCGIAGGIKDVSIGDVAVAKSAFNYDSGKESVNGFLPRPVEHSFSDELLAYAQLVQRAKTWKTRTLGGAKNANTFIASVAAGDKVVSAVHSSTFDRIQRFLSHCKFLEMEAAGFGLTIQRHRDIHAITIRGISDMCFNKAETDKEDWQAIAADHAAAFTFELISQIRPEAVIMDAKTIAKQVVDLLFPLLKLDSLTEIGTEFKQATDNSIKELWEIVKPWFIEEVANEENRQDAQIAVKTALRKELQQDSNLRSRVQKLIQDSPTPSYDDSTTSFKIGKIEGGIVNMNRGKNITQNFGNEKTDKD